jgi:peptidoglycan/LPS O-acetylase OafA/YrhL
MTGSRLQHLDGIRGIAAFAVFVCHFIQVFVPHVYYLDAAQGHGLWEDEFATSPFNIIVNGNFAVCLFFVLSGFVLSHRFLDTGDLDGLRRLAIKRYLRLALPVLAAVLLAWAILAAGSYSYGAVQPVTRSGMKDVYDAFVPFWAAVEEGVVGVFFRGEWNLNPVLWTMRIELYGSFLVFGLLALFGRTGYRWLVYGVAIAIFYESYYLAFLLGIALADLQLRADHRDAPLPVTLGAVMLGLYLGSYPYYGAEQGIWSVLPAVGTAHKPVLYHILGAAVLIQAANRFTGARLLLARPLFRFLGRISYGLYLIHFPLVCSVSAGLALVLLAHLDYGAAVALSFALSAPVVVVTAALFTTLVDQRAMRVADTFAALVMGAWRRPGLTLAPTFGGRPLEPGTLASTPSISLTSNTGECRG